MTSATSPTSDCARFDAQLGAWLEQELAPADAAFMAAHTASCAACEALVRDLDGLVAQAAALPPMAPSRDLWSGIEARLDAPVIPLPVANTAPRAGRTVSVRTFAIAAALLMAVSSGVTWRVMSSGKAGGDVSPTFTDVATTSSGDAGNTTDARATADETPGVTTQFAAATPVARPRGATVSRARFEDDDDVPAAGATFEREISALRRIVDERFTELDAATVTELRRNLDIIDRAIADSKTALARDPRSALLSSQLDRALEAKLDLLRRVALL